MNTALIQPFKRHGWKVIALIVFLVLQYQLWFDQSGLLANWKMQNLIEQRTETNEEFRAKNQVLTEEIIALRSGMDSLEAKARKELGMIKTGETYFIVVEGQD